MTTCTLDNTTRQQNGRSPGRSPTDEALLLDYRSTGCQTAFDQLVGRYESELYGYLRRMLQDADTAEDVFQATFLQIHRKCESFQEGLRFRPWLYAIATNQAIDAMRRNRRHRATSLNQRPATNAEELPEFIDMLAGDEVDPSEVLDREQLRMRVRDAVQELPVPLRSVVNLVVYQGLKYREAADALSIPIGTIKSRLHTAVKRLSATLREECPEAVVDHE